MDDGIAFQSLLVTVVVDFAVECVRIHPKVAHAKGFKQESECLEVIYQIVRTDTERCRRNGGVDKIAGVGGADGCFGANVQIPGAHVLDDKNFLQCHQVGMQRVDGNLVLLVDCDVVAYACLLVELAREHIKN